jgi:hypothetical protein
MFRGNARLNQADDGSMNGNAWLHGADDGSINARV